jgi:hypothetical protein
MPTTVAPPGWTMATRLLFPSNGPSQQPGIFLSSVGPVWYEVGGIKIPNLPPPGQWIDIDWTQIPDFPDDAVGLDLSGILILTDGSTSADESVALAFRAPGTDIPALGHYVMQTCAVGPTGGARSNGFSRVPVVNGHTQMSWERGNSNGEWPAAPLISQYPSNAAYGFNLLIQGIWLPDLQPTAGDSLSS